MLTRLPAPVTPPPRGWCHRRQDYNGCGCYKARLPQKCQSCKREVLQNDCIEKQVCGWVHVVCQGDSTRGLQSIISDFRHAPLDNQEEEMLSSVARRLLYSSEDEDNEHWQSAAETTQSSHAIPALVDNSDDEVEEEETLGLSAEQMRILSHKPQFGGPPVCINALAGCGKTTTIAFLCQRLEAMYPTANKLYLVYNNKTEIEAKQAGKFPKTRMEIRTTHAFVLRHYFGPQKMNLVNPLNEYALDDIKCVLDLAMKVRPFFPDVDLNCREYKAMLNSVANHVRKTVNNFETSDKMLLSSDHVYSNARTSTNSSTRLEWHDRIPLTKIVDWASEFFLTVQNRCHDVRERGLQGTGITHDGYLKVCQLEQINITSGFQFVIVDDAQDMTPCQAHLFWGNPSVRFNRAIYLFGDKCQQLYQFRGASHSFQDSWRETPNKYTLTGSFIFGTSIAEVASRILRAVDCDELLGRHPVQGEVHDIGHFENHGVVLCRTRVGMFQYLFFNMPRKWCYLDGSSNAFPEPPHWAYALESFLVEIDKFNNVMGEMSSLIAQMDILSNLMESTRLATVQSLPNVEATMATLAPLLAASSQSITSSRLQEVPPTFMYHDEVFSTVEEIKGFIHDEGDTVLLTYLMLLEFLKSQGKSLDEFRDSIQPSFCLLHGKPDDFDGVVLSTVHKARSVEFSRVLVYNDFELDHLANDTQERSSVLSEEASALYVAVTRAKDQLFLATREEV